MTKLLSEAFQKASVLPESLQNELAQELLDEIEWEMKWDESLNNTTEKLDRLAEKALKEHAAGKTEEMGFDEL